MPSEGARQQTIGTANRQCKLKKTFVWSLRNISSVFSTCFIIKTIEPTQVGSRSALPTNENITWESFLCNYFITRWNLWNIHFYFARYEGSMKSNIRWSFIFHNSFATECIQRIELKLKTNGYHHPSKVCASYCKRVHICALQGFFRSCICILLTFCGAKCEILAKCKNICALKTFSV